MLRSRAGHVPVISDLGGGLQGLGRRMVVDTGDAEFTGLEDSWQSSRDKQKTLKATCAKSAPAR